MSSRSFKDIGDALLKMYSIPSTTGRFSRLTTDSTAPIFHSRTDPALAPGEWYLDDGSDLDKTVVTYYKRGDDLTTLGTIAKAKAAKRKIRKAGLKREIKPKMNCWEMAKKVLEVGQHLILWGGTGLGKTSFAAKEGLKDGQTIYGLTLTDGMTLGDLFGRFWFKGGDSVWVDGPATKAMREGGRLILNEVESSPPEIMTALHALTDHPALASVVLPTGEVVAPGVGFQVVMTTNFEPSQSLPPALVDRHIVLHVTEANPEALKYLPDQYRPLAKSSAETGDPNRHISVRRWQQLASLRPVLDDNAFKAVFGSRADEVMTAVKLRG